MTSPESGAIATQPPGRGADPAAPATSCSTCRLIRRQLDVSSLGKPDLQPTCTAMLAAKQPDRIVDVHEYGPR